MSAKPGVPMSAYVSDVQEIERLVGGDKTKSLVPPEKMAWARALVDRLANYS